MLKIITKNQKTKRSLQGFRLHACATLSTLCMFTRLFSFFGAFFYTTETAERILTHNKSTAAFPCKDVLILRPKTALEVQE